MPGLSFVRKVMPLICSVPPFLPLLNENADFKDLFAALIVHMGRHFGNITVYVCVTELLPVANHPDLSFL